MLNKLTKLANKLDQLGLYEEAKTIDSVIKEAANMAAKDALIRALKNDDAQAAHKALTGLSGNDLGLTHQEFGKLTDEIQGAQGGAFPSLHKARAMLGVSKNIKLDPNTHNPMTGQPWNSGPVKIDPTLIDELKKIKAILDVDMKGRYYSQINGDNISIIGSYAKEPHDLVKKLKQLGFIKPTSPIEYDDGNFALLRKNGKADIDITIDLLHTSVPTSIDISPLTKKIYDAVKNVFGGFMGAKDFETAKKEFDDYINAVP